MLGAVSLSFPLPTQGQVQGRNEGTRKALDDFEGWIKNLCGAVAEKLFDLCGAVVERKSFPRGILCGEESALETRFKMIIKIHQN